MKDTLTDQDILWRMPYQTRTFYGGYYNRPGHFMEDAITDQGILWRVYKRPGYFMEGL